MLTAKKQYSYETAEAESSKQESSSSTYRVLEERPTQQGTVRVTNRPSTLAEETVIRTTLMLFVLTVSYAITFTVANIFVMTANAVLSHIIAKVFASLLIINCITHPVCFFCMSSKYRESA